MDPQTQPTPAPDAVEKKHYFLGVSDQISLGDRSDTHKRFAARLTSKDPKMSNREFVECLLDTYDRKAKDNSTEVTYLQQQLNDANLKIASYEEQQTSWAKKLDNAVTQTIEQRNQIQDLQQQLSDARNDANDNALKAQAIQMQHQAKDGEIRFTPNPVVAYFLDEMATKTGKDPSYILEKLYMDDLQNPRANNLPYTVTAADIRRVIAELKKEE